MNVTLGRAELQSMFPRADRRHIDDITDNLDIIESAQINKTVNRISYFCAQLGHESGGLSRLEENLNYSAAQMQKVWPSRFPTKADAQKFVGKPRELANYVYGGRLGNTDPNDGWLYRGRGYIQLTGKENYRKFGQLLDLPLERNPDLATDPVVAMRIAVEYWKKIGGNRYADRDDFTGLTRAINGGTVGMADRRDWLKKAYRVFSNEPVAPGSLRRSRTMQGSTAAAGGGAMLLLGEVTEVTEHTRTLQDYWDDGSLIKIAIGVIILLGALYALYARWDDAGRPLPWKKSAEEE